MSDYQIQPKEYPPGYSRKCYFEEQEVGLDGIKLYVVPRYSCVGRKMKVYLRKATTQQALPDDKRIQVQQNS
jgi:hypothetical protein